MNTLTMMPARVRVASELRKAIYAREYRSGDPLSLTEVAERLGISRTPVREAFQELENEGLITLRMNRGAVVNNIDCEGVFLKLLDPARAGVFVPSEQKAGEDLIVLQMPMMI